MSLPSPMVAERKSRRLWWVRSPPPWLPLLGRRLPDACCSCRRCLLEGLLECLLLGRLGEGVLLVLASAANAVSRSPSPGDAQRDCMRAALHWSAMLPGRGCCRLARLDQALRNPGNQRP